MITYDPSDRSYVPRHVVVKGGEQISSMEVLQETTIEMQRSPGNKDVIVLSDQSTHYPIIDITIKDCQGT